MTAVGAETGKILDAEVLSSYRSACKHWTGLNGTASERHWEAWYEQHKNSCTRTHEGSASSMEVHAVQNIFQRSVEKYNVKYVMYIGDRDTKSYSTIEQERSYGEETPVEKIECVGHVQKRFSSKARKLKVSLKGKKL